MNLKIFLLMCLIILNIGLISLNSKECIKHLLIFDFEKSKSLHGFFKNINDLVENHAEQDKIFKLKIY